MIRKAFVMSVHPEAKEEYIRRHSPIPATLAAVLRSHGVTNYSIFLDEQTCTLFGYAEIRSEKEWAAIAETEACRDWWKFMKDIMLTNPDNSPVSKALTEAFHLDQLA